MRVKFGRATGSITLRAAIIGVVAAVAVPMVASAATTRGQHNTKHASTAWAKSHPTAARKLAPAGSASSASSSAGSSSASASGAGAGSGGSATSGAATSAAPSGPGLPAAPTSASSAPSKQASTSAAAPPKTTAAAPPASPNQPADNKLVFSDDFGGSALNTSWWSVYDTTSTSTPTSRVPSLLSVSGGALHVSTSGNSGSGLCLCQAGVKSTTPYGRWDVRARMSADTTHGFAIMLWPNAENWPVGGEIDLAEAPTASRSQIQFTDHYSSSNQQYKFFQNGDFTAWHTFSVEWTHSYIKYWIDGVLMTTITTAGMIPTGAMHLALQAGPDTDSPAATSAVMDVDWVRVYSG